MRLHHLRREDKAASSNDDRPGARIPVRGIAELSLGTMTLQTIVKTASLVEYKPMVAGRRRHIPREERTSSDGSKDHPNDQYRSWPMFVRITADPAPRPSS